MPEITTDQKNIAILLALQKGEITEHLIYTKIAATTTDEHSLMVLTKIASDELDHYGIWKRYTKRDVKPDIFRVWFYYVLVRLLGLPFAIKLLEGVEKKAESLDRTIPFTIPEIAGIVKNEEIHERELIALIDDDHLKYVGSVVLGLNNALVEFTGTLAGLTFAIQNTQIIAVVGLVMGVTASLSVGTSEYLSRRSDVGPLDAFKASVCTGITYIFTVTLLFLPFLLLSSPVIALIFTLLVAIIVIFVFTFYVSVATDLPFYRRFAETAAISLGIASIAFLIGVAIRTILNVNI